MNSLINNFPRGNSSTPTSIVDKTKDVANHFTPIEKILIASGVGIILLGITAGIIYCCYRRRNRTVNVRPGQRVNMTYELGELSSRRNQRR